MAGGPSCASQHKRKSAYFTAKAMGRDGLSNNDT